MKLLTRSFIFCFLFVCAGSHAAIIKGVITDQKGEGLSFVNVFVKGTTIATTCNEAGHYQLKIGEGNWEIGFQYIGFKARTERVAVGADEVKVLNVKLEEETYNLKEFSVTATAEDPAYPIMRQAMAMRKVYLFEAKEFSALVYLKGMQRLTTIPKRVLLFKIPTDVKPGIIYLSESLSELSYQQPDKIKERMISSKVSGDNRAFSFNRAGAIKFNLYENLINSFGLNERGFISPLANNAFMYYKYRLEGESKENGHTLYKIRLLPIRENDPVFRGHIYIVKDSWRIHSTDLLLSKKAQIEFVDTLYIKQVFAPQAGGVWMPVSQRFIFQFEAFGFRGNGYFVAAYSKYRVNSMYPSTFYGKQEEEIKKDENVPQVKRVARKKVEKKTADTSLFDKRHFNNEVMRIENKSNRTEDSVWETIRPVPLTDEEKLDYKEKDSIRAIEESRPYLDSIDRINNKLDWPDIFVTGYSYEQSFRKRSFHVDPLFTTVQYNTVEGWVLNPSLTYTRYTDDNKWWEIEPNIRYGFASERFYAQAHSVIYNDPVKGTTWRFAGGHFVEQFNRDESITPLLNSIYSLFAERNYLKEYEKSFGTVSYRSRVVNGVTLTSAVEYAQRRLLVNHADYRFTEVPDREFTSNTPLNVELTNTDFATHNAMTLHVNFDFRIKQKYITRPDSRYYFRSKYPAFQVGYVKGINGLGSSIDYDKITAGISYDHEFGLFGASGIRVKAGAFLRSNSMYFMDYHHFNGNRTLFAFGDYRGFQLLDYYFYSTRKSFIEAHYYHHFNGFFVNKIPLLRKLKWQEVVSFNYLKTPSSPGYIELGAGIEHIFKVIGADFFTSFEDGKQHRYGVVIGFGF